MVSKTPRKTVTAGKSSSVARGLGRGLSTLLGDSGVATVASQTEPLNAREYKQIPVDRINVGPWQPRRLFDPEKLHELASSIRQKGIVQPILLRPMPDYLGRYQLVAGERRWRASQLAKLHEIPAVIRTLSDVECYEIALIENIQRQDLSVIDEAQGYSNLIEVNKYTQEQLSNVIGKSRSHIANLLRLLGLPDAVQTLMRNGDLSMGQARPLIGHPQAEFLAKRIVEKNLSTRQVEALLKSIVSSDTVSPKTSKKAQKSADIKALEQRAAIELGLAMSIDWSEQAETGCLHIKCQSLEQVTAILEKLGLSH